MKEKRLAINEIENPLLLGTIRLTLTGTHCALVENFKGIIEYNDEMVIIQSRKERLTLRGTGLQIPYYTRDEMKVLGAIETIEVKDCCV
ncbi:MAG: YabP/YqfC family sporulation protein [Lachnospiraceae bacterium]|nr:YabP/YqfC family sporulation protein [Lachnospiraceae bacterium]